MMKKRPRQISDAAIFLAFIALALLHPLVSGAAELDHEPAKPLAEGAATTPSEDTKASNELAIRLGNESNTPDGVWGPYTYGLRGAHTFENGLNFEAGYVRLHEPLTPAIASAVDEAQATLRSSDVQVHGQSFVLAGTLWQNRMIDMYTNLAGMEVTWKSHVSLTVGGYSGTAQRSDLNENFHGFQVSLSGEFGPLEISAGHINGRIEDGAYRKSAFELASTVLKGYQVPTTLTLSFEDRYFDFGKGGPSSDPADEKIVIIGAELHLEELLFKPLNSRRPRQNRQIAKQSTALRE